MLIDRLAPAAACALVLASCFSKPAENENIKSAASAFYDVYIKLRPSGVPPKEQIEQFKGVISADLNALLRGAAEAEAAYFAATHGESPPLVEGDLFTSLFEGAESYGVGQCEKQKAETACLVELTHGDIGGSSTFKWKDRVFVVRENDGWVVDDVEFLGDWQFMHKGRLKELLKEIVEEAKSAAT